MSAGVCTSGVPTNLSAGDRLLSCSRTVPLDLGVYCFSSWRLRSASPVVWADKHLSALPLPGVLPAPWVGKSCCCSCFRGQTPMEQNVSFYFYPRHLPFLSKRVLSPKWSFGFLFLCNLSRQVCGGGLNVPMKFSLLNKVLSRVSVPQSYMLNV